MLSARPELRLNYIMDYTLPSPIKIKLDNVTSRIDYNREHWLCGEHALMCAHWLSSDHDPIYTTSITTNNFSHIVCQIPSIGCFDADLNKFFSNFTYGKDLMDLSSFEEADSFIEDWPTFEPAFGYNYYNYSLKDIVFINVSKYSRCHVPSSK